MIQFKGEVRVNCSTYNHAPFITDALNGFTIQKTTFPYTCCIVDDASTDGAQMVIKKYLQDNFELDDKTVVIEEETDDYVMTYARHKSNVNCYFAVYLLKYNHYSIKKPKVPFIMQWSNTKYLAQCEGDDYWIDQYKLQKQVSFLEEHNDYGLCYTKSIIYDQDHKINTGDVGKKYISYKEMLLSNPVPTLSTLYKLDLFVKYAKEVTPSSHNWKQGDYPFWLYLAANSKIHFIDEITSVYRAHGGSMSRPNNIEDKIVFIASRKDIRMYFAKKYMPEKSICDAIEKEYDKDFVDTCISYHNISLGIKKVLNSTHFNIKEKMIHILRILKSSFVN